MRRHDALIPLTHDHHHALRNARMLREGADAGGAEALEAARAFVGFFRDESVTHFREEEEIVFPVVALHENAPTEGIARVLDDHVRMHALVRKLDAQIEAAEVDRELLRLLSTTLKAHVRFEEDKLFPRIEELAASELGQVQLSERTRRPQEP